MHHEGKREEDQDQGMIPIMIFDQRRINLRFKSCWTTTILLTEQILDVLYQSETADHEYHFRISYRIILWELPIFMISPLIWSFCWAQSKLFSVVQTCVAMRSVQYKD